MLVHSYVAPHDGIYVISYAGVSSLIWQEAVYVQLCLAGACWSPAFFNVLHGSTPSVRPYLAAAEKTTCGIVSMRNCRSPCLNESAAFLPNAARP